MQKFKLLFTFLLLTTCAACTVPSIPIIGELDRNRRKWNNSDIKSYKMWFKIQRTGHRQPNGVVLSEVRDGNLVSSVPTTEMGFPGTDSMFQPYDTVDEMFELIESGQNSFADELIVEYDAELGYPKKIRLDYRRSTFDDEVSLEVQKLEPIR